VPVFAEFGVQVVDELPEGTREQQRKLEARSSHAFIVAGMDRLDNQVYGIDNEVVRFYGR
jgi:hypothetical protein